ncbi:MULTISPECIES: cutinase family protein [unclassified Nocardioides]|uniref:cutinase family protein n=1 Tax=unclassified Nocardioides TaxID=2615069 RepID=UPI00360E6C64
MDYGPGMVLRRRPVHTTGRAIAAAAVLLAGALAVVPAATGSSAAAAPRTQVVACIYDSAQGSGPWAHTIGVSGNGRRGAKVTRSLAEGMVPLGLDHGGGERSYAWTPATRPLTRAALAQVRRRHLDAAYFRGTDKNARRLAAKIRQRVADCPEEGLILVGYSQGALVVRAALARIAKRDDGADLLDHVGAVLLVGDPAARRSEDVRRYGVKRQDGPVRGARLPTVLTKRDLVASWCRSADALCSTSRVAARRAVRAHRGYQLPAGGSSPGRRAADYLTGPINDPVLVPVPHEGPDFVRGEQVSGWRVLERLSGAAAELRLDRDLTAPTWMTVADDLSLSGTAQSGSSTDVFLGLGFHHRRFAPATHRFWESSLDVYPVRAAKPGVRLVSHGVGGARPNGHSFAADISADGQTVVFVSAATNLVAGDTDGQPNVFAWDRATDTITRVSEGLGTTSSAANLWPHVSADGRMVSWLSGADHPSLGDNDGRTDAYLHDRHNDTTQLASPGVAGTVSAATLADDGSTVYLREGAGAVESTADTVRTWAVGGAATTALTPPTNGGWLPAGAGGEALVISANGRYALARIGSAHVSWDLVGGAAVASCPLATSGPGGGAISDDGQTFTGGWSDANGITHRRSLTCDHGTSLVPDDRTPTVDLSSDGRYLSWVRDSVGDPIMVLDLDSTPGESAVYTAHSATSSLASAASADAQAVVFDGSAFNVVETPASQRGIREIYLWDRTVSP